LAKSDVEAIGSLLHNRLQEAAVKVRPRSLIISGGWKH